MSEATNASSAATQSSSVPSIESADSSVDSSQQASSQLEGHTSEASIDADPSMSKAEKVEAKKMLKSLKIKFNGKEIEESLPFEIPDDEQSIEYMKKQLQMSKLAQSKSQELSQLQKDAVDFIEQLRKNPRKVLSDPNIGVDLKKIAIELIEEEVENAKKSPEQLEKEKLQKELEELKEARKKESEEQQKREFERIQQQEYERYDMLMSQALDKSDLPKSPYVIKKMADYMLLGLKNGIDVTPDDVLPMVRDEIREDLQQMFQVMPEDVIEQFIGKETFNKVRKKNLQKAKQAQQITKAKQIQDVGVTKQQNSDKPADKQPMKKFFGF